MNESAYCKEAAEHWVGTSGAPGAGAGADADELDCTGLRAWTMRAKMSFGFSIRIALILNVFLR